MLKTSYGFSGCVTAPHRLATKAGVDILEAGGTAVEAMVAAAATIAVVYPHMNSIGGDGFWIIKKKGQAPISIEACGQAARLATVAAYAKQGYSDQIPTRGGPAALTVPGTIGGWKKALEYDSSPSPLPLADLLANASKYARNGIAVTKNQFECTRDKLQGLSDVPGFANVYLDKGNAPSTGSCLKQTALANTFEHLSRFGLDAYYNGDIAYAHDDFWRNNDSPLRAEDLTDYKCVQTRPLEITTSLGTFYNTNPPTQGVSSLMILGIFDRLNAENPDGFDHVHGLVEATKQAFTIRNRELGDALSMNKKASELLASALLDELASDIDPAIASPWPYEQKKGDTIWMGACDKEGTMVSFIQSVFWEFGSGLTCPETGVFFQNRGAGFSLAKGPNQLAPGRKPFHTLNPAFAELADGRLMAYGTMGGEGQPQTQAALLTRYAAFGVDLQDAITAPRWLLGKTWGENTSSLKVENNIEPELVDALIEAGHDVEYVSALNDIMGHAGAIVLHKNNLIAGANDPRSDGLALAF
ncbi:MAG: gamma-glutamyltransferase [Hyphomicrobiales bacterium]